MAQEVLTLAFADGEYEFRLSLSGINEIQKKCDAGIGKVWSRLAHSRLNYLGEDVGIPADAMFRIEDVIEPIRQGLIGGKKGMVDGEPVEVTSIVANRLIENYVLNEPLQKGWATAYAIIGSLLEGYDPPKKKAESQMTRDGSTTDQL